RSGGFLLPPVPPGKYEVSLSRSSRNHYGAEPLITEQPGAVAIPQFHELDGKQETVDIAIETVPTIRLSGTILGPEGKPFQGAKLMVSGDIGQGRGYESLDQCQTNAEGKYVLQNIPRGCQSLQLFVSAYQDRQML